ncbi:patatin [Alcanivorax nanhaiticus]|uniref:Patatin n=1 Tax=Alcanivorax nanhaiticus TaxID=1177154 RepID=A0A095SIT8_9GAMM|nr:patatin [Alcanivorax nanhaiticus]
MAHIGVLKALDEHGIHPTAVAGTSMGSIVGGLYATGYSVEQIEQIATEMNWKEAFSDNSPRSHSLFAYRQMDAGAPVDYRLRINRKGIALPRAALQGQHLTLILDEIFSPARDITDFDQLAVPYRAVAADLVTGEQVVLKSGRLSSAVRASMSIPGLLEPTIIDDKLLVDGGIANNVPIDALKDQQLDRLVVVDVGSPRWEKEDITSIGLVLAQLSALLVRNNSDQSLSRLQEQDIVIKPNLEGISSSDFSKAKQAIDAGYAAAIQVLGPAPARQQPLSDEPPAKLIAPLDTSPVIDEIVISNGGVVSDKVIRAMIRQQPGEPLDRATIRDDISHIYALDYHDSIRYQLKNVGGKNLLYIEAEERDTSNTFAQLGLQFSDDMKGNGTFGLFGSLRIAGLNSYGGTAAILANLGSRPMLEARFFQPVDHKLIFFVEPVAGYRADSIDLYLNNDIDDPAFATFRRTEVYGGIDAGAALFRQKGELRFGVQATGGDVETQVGVPFDIESYQDRYAFTRLSWDTYDNLAFPSKGIKAALEYQHHDPDFGADLEYDRQLTELGWATTLAGFSVVAEAYAAISDEEPGSEAIEPLGGFLRLSGLPPDSIWGNHSALGRLVVTRPLRHNLILPSSVQVYAGASYETGNVWLDRDDVDTSSLLSGGSLFLGTHTPLGPGYVSVGYTEGDHYSFNIYFGHVFR